ncbi:hypothetical protein ACS0TY_008999 [Phlomoides rotata]
MAKSKIEFDIVLKSSAEKLWRNFKDFATTFPKALPHTYESIEIIEGDGKSVGSILKHNYSTDFKPELYIGVVSTTWSTKRIDLVDEEKKTMSYTFLKGDILNYYKNFKSTVCVSDAEGDGCVVKYIAEFEKANEQIPDPILFKEFAVKAYHDFDAYLVNMGGSDE